MLNFLSNLVALGLRSQPQPVMGFFVIIILLLVGVGTAFLIGRLISRKLVSKSQKKNLLATQTQQKSTKKQLKMPFKAQVEIEDRRIPSSGKKRLERILQLNSTTKALRVAIARNRQNLAICQEDLGKLEKIEQKAKELIRRKNGEINEKVDRITEINQKLEDSNAQLREVESDLQQRDKIIQEKQKKVLEELNVLKNGIQGSVERLKELMKM